MPGRHESWLVKCPFYHGEKDSTVTCEGSIKNSTINIVLSNRTAKNGYQKDFCRRNWQNCLIAKALMDKYKEGDDAKIS